MGNLALEFGVSVRTVQRDISEITTIVPIYIKTGRYGGGVYVMDHFNTHTQRLNKDEIKLLYRIHTYFMSNDNGYLNDEEKKVLNNIIAR